MLTTRAQVADLQPGDVVEIRETDHPEVVTRGPLHEAPNKALDLGGIFRVRAADGSARLSCRYQFTVVSRAPRPLYVNHPRTEPVRGDVVRDADSDDGTTWVLADTDDRPWICPVLGENWMPRDDLPARLRLLVDGTTGQVVP